MGKNISILANGIAGNSDGLVRAIHETDVQGILAPIDGVLDRDSVKNVIGQDGLLKEVPKNQLAVDWTNGVAEILLEPLSENLVVYSEDFTIWSGSGVVLTPNQPSIKGDNSATMLSFSSLSDYIVWALTGISVSVGDKVTISRRVGNRFRLIGYGLITE